MLIQTPPWVLIDGTFGLLDDDVLELVIDVFTKELKGSGIVHIGGPGEAHDLFSAVLHLIKTPPASQLDCFLDRESTRLNSSHPIISYSVLFLKKKKRM